MGMDGIGLLEGVCIRLAVACGFAVLRLEALAR